MASIEKVSWNTASDRPSHRWQVRYRDQDGNQRSRNFKLKADAKEFAESVDAEVRRGIHIPRAASATIKEAAEIWIKAVAVGRDGRPPAERSTTDQYRQHIDLHIVPFLGDIRLVDLTTPAVVNYRDDLLEAGRSRAMVRKILTSLKSLITEAQTRGLVIGNAALPVKIITTGRHKEAIRVPAKADVKAIAHQTFRWASGDFPRSRHKAGILRHQWFHALLLTAIGTGMRASELRGLTWGNVNFDLGHIDVENRADEWGDIGPTKSASGRRSIHIAPFLIGALREWRSLCPANDRGLVFPNGAGNVESLANIHSRWWGPAQVAAGVCDPEEVEGVAGEKIVRQVPRYTFHELRHFRASIMIAGGTNPLTVKEQMGHANVEVTMGIYGHLFKDQESITRQKGQIASAEFDLLPSLT